MIDKKKVNEKKILWEFGDKRRRTRIRKKTQIIKEEKIGLREEMPGMKLRKRSQTHKERIRQRIKPKRKGRRGRQRKEKLRRIRDK